MSETNQNEAAELSGGKPAVSRRDFLNEITLGALGVAGLGSAALTYQYFSPNVLFEPSTTFRAGNPDLYPLDSVTFLQDQQVYIVRTDAGFYAVSAVCTHLGCITQWKPEANMIACPCHGSKFQPNGRKIEGPAPRPLPHYSINLTADGELQVDKLQIIKSDQVLKV
ncbi:MAG TPA: ubiquinol-cytochrome c reductase iron-sulfur subunit [Candidatus Eremiobacteraceae bacterium]|nr:ubiquinol-cytochrome c reductase iron-sulfur subunit [Candidatus Eremiobacteraceae bacterium]